MAPGPCGAASARLGELVLRDRDGDLARLRLDQGGEGENGAVGESAQDPKNHEEADQTRHLIPVRPGGPPRTRRFGTEPWPELIKRIYGGTGGRAWGRTPN